MTAADTSARDGARTATAPPAGTGGTGASPVALVLGGAVVTLGAVALADRLPLVALLLVLGGAAWLGWQVLHRFEVLVLALLALRPVVDLTARAAGPIREVPSVLGASLIVAGTVWLWLNRRDGRTVVVSPLQAATVVVVAAAAVATLASPAPLTSAVDSARLLAGLVMLLLVRRLVDGGTPAARLLGAAGAAAAVAMVVPLVGPLVGISITHVKDGTTALRSTFFLSNNFAHFLVPVVLVVAGVALRGRGRLRLVAGVVAVAAVAEVGLTATRGAWLALLVGLLVLGMLLERRLVAVVVVGAVAAALLVPAVTTRLLDLLPDDAPRTENSLTWRFGQWEEAVELATDSPVVGIGPGMTRETIGKEPHSEWVRFLTELGGLGLLAWTAFVTAMVALVVRVRRLAEPGTLADGVTAGIAATVAAFVTASFGENLVLTTSYSWYLALLLGIADAWVARGVIDLAPLDADVT